jgi:hypothetical protein
MSCTEITNFQNDSYKINIFAIFRYSLITSLYNSLI